MSNSDSLKSGVDSTGIENAGQESTNMVTPNATNSIRNENTDHQQVNPLDCPSPSTKPKSATELTGVAMASDAFSTISSHTELDNDNFEDSKTILKFRGTGIIGCLERVSWFIFTKQKKFNFYTKYFMLV